MDHIIYLMFTEYLVMYFVVHFWRKHEKDIIESEPVF